MSVRPLRGQIIGSGDHPYIYRQTAGSLLDIAVGTTADPDTSHNPALQVSRTLSFSALTGDGSEETPAISGISVVPASGTTIQPVGVFAGAKHLGNGDANGIYARGVVSGTGSGGGIGGFFAGEARSPNAHATGMEIYVLNASGSADTGAATNGTGGESVGIWMNASGSTVGNAYTIGAGFGVQFAVGFHAMASSILSSTFRDDSSAVYSVEVKGSHTYGFRDASTSTSAIRLDGSYTTGIDLTGGTFGVGAIYLGNGSTQGILMKNAAGSAVHRVMDYDSSNNLQLGAGISGNLYSAKLHIFGGGINVSAQNIATDTTTGTKIGTGTTQKLGFFNKTPIVQPGAITSPTGGATIDSQARTAIDAIRTALTNLGLTA